MKAIVTFGLGLLAGAGMVYMAIWPARQDTFVATRDISLRLKATNLGILPKGQPVIALGSTSFQPDIGWFGCIPVNFGTGFEARDLLESSTVSPTSDVTLFAAPPEQRPGEAPSSPPS
jgi:hypothetical protein